LFSLVCSCSFADSYYRNELESFAQKLVFDEYNSQFTLQETEKLIVKAAPLDKRINYPTCVTGLTGEIVNNKIKSTTSVKVSCLDEKQWNVYLRIRVNLLLKVVVTNSALSKGQTLNETNIVSTYMDKSRIRNGGFTTTSSLYGTRLKRNLGSHKVVKDRDICFVCKGDKVSITANQSGLSIKASGVALSDANIGGTVRVKNSRTQRIVVGTVSDLKKVNVSF